MGAWDVASSHLASALRLGAGVRVGPLGPRPSQLLELYDFEACPFCRKVREALTALDLDAVILPCPKGGTRYREALEKRGGKQQFPYLVDPNTDTEMYESSAIVEHLFRTYGDGPAPLSLKLGPVTVMTSSLSSLTRPTKGSRARPSNPPDRALELYSFEASPYCRLVREELCSLELPYVLHNVGKGSPSRDALRERAGKLAVPYFVDPAAGVEMFESAEIVAYLRRTYGG